MALVIETHQELLDRWYEIEMSNIWERSGNIDKDSAEVDKVAREYAGAHDLNFPTEKLRVQAI